jgi:hypothetical protein
MDVCSFQSNVDPNKLHVIIIELYHSGAFVLDI